MTPFRDFEARMRVAEKLHRAPRTYPHRDAFLPPRDLDFADIAVGQPYEFRRIGNVGVGTIEQHCDAGPFAGEARELLPFVHARAI